MSRRIEELNKQEMQEIVQEILDRRKGKNDKRWIDIVNDYDLSCTSDDLRKLAFGVRFANDAGMQFDPNQQKSIDKGFTERQKLYDMQRQLKKDMRELSRTELICEYIDKAIASLPKIELSNTLTSRKKNRRRDLVVGIGDFHYGADFDVLGLYGEVINKYDSLVFEKRMAALLEEIVEVADKDDPDQITVMIAGDMLDGLLRTSQLQRLEFGVIESAMRLSETLACWLGELENAVDVPIRVYAVRGNHGEIRPLGTKAGQFPEENMERIVMHYLYARFKGERSVIISQNDAPMTQIVDVCGYQFLLTHGQDTNIQSLAKDCVNLYQKPIDVFIVGHLHKGQSFTSGIMPESNIYVERVPSLCGIDPYAQSKGYGAQPGATLILMEEGYGRKCIYPIVLK